MLNKKSIVLNGVNESSKRAVLTLECNGELTKGTIRLYNFGIEPRGIVSLGIYYDGFVVKAGLTHKGGFVYTFNCALSSIPQKFSCAVVNFFDGEPSPILYGNSDGYVDHESLFEEVISSLGHAKNVSEVEQILDSTGIDFDEKMQKQIDEDIENCFEEKCCNECDNCKYKEFYLRNFSVLNVEDGKDNIEKEITKEESFYQEIKTQIDSLFENNPNEEYLESLVPHSKWIKVGLDDGSNYYVLGLIYEDESLKYICYGVPGVFQKNPPRELSGFPVWFPLDENKPQGFGYWLSYQDADSGESVRAVVV